MSEVLTEKQEAVLSFIEDYQLNHGKSPTIKEMKEHFEVSSDNSILKHLKALQEKGYIEKDDTPRGIKLLEAVKGKLICSEMINLPLLGFIPAGGPVLTDEYVESWVSVGEDIVGSKSEGLFLLRVTGDSMIDAGIYEGDIVVVDAKKTAKNGDIVVGLVDSGNTLKRLIKEGNKAYLKAENKDYSDIYPVSELEVQGVITSLIRRY